MGENGEFDLCDKRAEDDAFARTLTEEQLKLIFKEHKLWLSGQGGSRACLDGTILHKADLSRVDLRGASLQHADLSGADLTGANLGGADLRWTNLSSAILYHTDLSLADLRWANLNFAYLHGTDFYDADLREASLSRTSYLYAAKNAGIVFSLGNILPDGELIGWKKCRENRIVKLRIPADSKRLNAPYCRKCRAEKAEVLAIYNFDGTMSEDGFARSLIDESFVYRVGEMVEPTKPFDIYQDSFSECGIGIHFFITRKEAEDFHGWA